MAMRILVHQMKGEDATIDVLPDTTIRDLKRQLKGLQVAEDELTRKMSLVEVIVGDRKLVRNQETVIQAGISSEVAVQVVFSIKEVECVNLQSVPCDKEDFLVLRFPESELRIEDFAFEDAGNLVSASLGSSLTQIGAYAFANCSSLARVTMPSSVSSIDLGAFRNCRSLTTLAIPDALTEIQEGAFACCSSLRSIEIPESGNIITYNTVIAALEKGAQWQKALVFLSLALELFDNGATIITYSSAISACEKGKRWQEAVWLLSLAESRLRGNVVAFTAAIRACSQATSWRLALNLLQELEHRQEANFMSYDAAILAFFLICFEEGRTVELGVVTSLLNASYDAVVEVDDSWKLLGESTRLLSTMLGYGESEAGEVRSSLLDFFTEEDQERISQQLSDEPFMAEATSSCSSKEVVASEDLFVAFDVENFNMFILSSAMERWCQEELSKIPEPW
eukprot:g3641.t1